MPYFAGESAMLRFNDEWVKGGGFWLAPSSPQTATFEVS
jgi:hypothetical protein